MREMIIMTAFALALVSCAHGDSIPPKRFSAVTDTLSEGKHFALVDFGDEKALLITDYVYDDLEGHMATITARIYSTDAEGKVVDCGSVISQGTAYPLAVKDGLLFTAGHRFIKKYTLKHGGGQLLEAGDMLEVLDTLGEPLHYIIDGDRVCFPEDNLVRAAFDEWAGAEVLSFSPVR